MAGAGPLREGLPIDPDPLQVALEHPKTSDSALEDAIGMTLARDVFIAGLAMSLR